MKPQPFGLYRTSRPYVNGANVALNRCHTLLAITDGTTLHARAYAITAHFKLVKGVLKVNKLGTPLAIAPFVSVFPFDRPGLPPDYGSTLFAVSLQEYSHWLRGRTVNIIDLINPTTRSAVAILDSPVNVIDPYRVSVLQSIFARSGQARPP